MHVRRWPFVALAAVLLLTLPPAGDATLALARILGYTVCHQLPEHSLSMAGQQLPLCARCTGLYIGFLVGLLGMAIQGKLRASQLPPSTVTGLLLAAFAAMAADGFNSLLGFLSDAPPPYEPSNLLRLITGTAAGASLALLLLPLLNESMWAKPDRSPSVDDLGDLAGYTILAALAVALVGSEHPALLYPTALASALGVLAALSTAGAALAATLSRRKVQAGNGGVPRPVLAGLALAVISMALLGGARAYFSLPLGLAVVSAVAR